MENPKIGEKVKFLDRTGGGVIVEIRDPKTVVVAGDDGFDLPVLITELVRIDPTDAAGRFFEGRSLFAKEKPADKGNPDPEPGTEDLNKNITSDIKDGSIFLAFVPHDQKYLMTGYIDVFLVNNTPFDLLYNLFHLTPTGHYEGVDYGSVFSGTRQHLATVNRESIARWSDGYLQFLFHANQVQEVPPPVNSEFRIDGKKFFKEGNYQLSPHIEGRGIVIRVLTRVNG